MTAENDIMRKLQPLSDYLEREVRSELERQGHVATGKLRDSIKSAVVKSAQGYAIEGRGSIIGKYVDWGRRPGGKKVPVSALIAWVQVKGFATGDKAVSLAWAIQNSIYKHGIPTDGNDAKKKFISRTLTGNKDKIRSGVEAASYEFLTVEINNIIRDIKEKINVY